MTVYDYMGDSSHTESCPRSGHFCLDGNAPRCAQCGSWIVSIPDAYVLARRDDVLRLELVDKLKDGITAAIEEILG